MQVKPSLQSGRYNQLVRTSPNDDVTYNNRSIDFHWDKDEDLRILMGGGNMYVHPHLSTVTYLTDKVGAPTLVLECRVDPHTGAVDEQRSFKAGYARWPRKGKHLKFDGSLLHAAPIDL